MAEFKSKYPVKDRRNECSRIRQKYPDRIPIICEKSATCNDTTIASITKCRYLVPNDLSAGQFMYVIRKRMKLSSDKAIFLFVGDKGSMAPSSKLLSDLYLQYKDAEDSFLYITYSGESTFGH